MRGPRVALGAIAGQPLADRDARHALRALLGRLALGALGALADVADGLPVGGAFLPVDLARRPLAVRRLDGRGGRLRTRGIGLARGRGGGGGRGLVGRGGGGGGRRLSEAGRPRRDAGGAEPAGSLEAGEGAGVVDLRRREVPEGSRRGRVSLAMMFHTPVQTKSVIVSSRWVTTGLVARRNRFGIIQQGDATGWGVR